MLLGVLVDTHIQKNNRVVCAEKNYLSLLLMVFYYFHEIFVREDNQLSLMLKIHAFYVN